MNDISYIGKIQKLFRIQDYKAKYVQVFQIGKSLKFSSFGLFDRRGEMLGFADETSLSINLSFYIAWDSIGLIKRSLKVSS